MSGHSTSPYPIVNEKRQRLKEIVARLGADASPAEIRQEAWRVGFGAINAQMLVWVRNELWPNRPKRSAGRPKGTTATTLIVPSVDGVPSCPLCDSLRARHRGKRICKDGSVYRRFTCQKCHHGFSIVYEPGHKLPRRERLLAVLATEKECAACKKILPVDNFSRKDNYFLRPYCKVCTNEKRAKYQLIEDERKYGLCPEQYAEMLSRQAHRCAICGSKGRGKGSCKRPLCIDHCHASGIVRGLLCDKCNLGLGNFDDDLSRLESAVTYLRAYRSICRKEIHDG